jgi:hypothetical protein
MQVLIATSSNGKLRDFSGAVAVYGIVLEGLQVCPKQSEDGATFEEARSL